MKKEQEQEQEQGRLQKDKINMKERVEAVVELLRKQAPLSLKQEKFCNNACVERFLKSKGCRCSVKKAAKHLRACLSWRSDATMSIDNMMADEFAAELAEGLAYVAGHDHESRPVLVFRIKQDYQKSQQKMLSRLVVFTLEVAIQTMPRNVQQLVLLFDASFYRSASAFMNVFLTTMKMVADYYPGRLHKAFVVDSPSLFSYLWKGVRAFVELAQVTSVVSSLDMEDPLDLNNDDYKYFTAGGCRRRGSSLRFDGDQSTAAKIGSCSSSRFSFTVSHHLDTLKPWYLSLADTSAPSKVGPARISPLNSSRINNARSLSFASPVEYRSTTPRGNELYVIRKGFFPSTPLPRKSQPMDHSGVNQPRTPKPSFFQSPAVFFRREVTSTKSKAEKCKRSKLEESSSSSSFVPYLKFHRRPYDEMTYRSKMRPPLGGLISIVPAAHCSKIKRRGHISLSQRY